MLAKLGFFLLKGPNLSSSSQFDIPIRLYTAIPHFVAVDMKSNPFPWFYLFYFSKKPHCLWEVQPSCSHRDHAKSNRGQIRRPCNVEKLGLAFLGGFCNGDDIAIP
jgi:hypothetical protein